MTDATFAADGSVQVGNHTNENQFVWTDHSSVDYLNWNSGEPNQCEGCGGEDGVSIDFRWRSGDSYEFGGGWNDANDYGSAGSPAHSNDAAQSLCWGCYGPVGYFPVCQTSAAPPPEAGIMVTPYRRQEPVRACIPPGVGGQPAQPNELAPGQFQNGVVPGICGGAPPPPCVGLSPTDAFSAYRFRVTHVRDPSRANSVQYSELHFFDRDEEKTCHFDQGCRAFNPGGSNPHQRRSQCVRIHCNSVCTPDAQDPGMQSCARIGPQGQPVDPIRGNVGACTSANPADPLAMKEVCAGGLGSELPEMAFDHNQNTKFLDFNHGQRSASSGTTTSTDAIAASNLMVWFHQPTHITSYTFWTANDAPERDPSSWTMEGCTTPCDPDLPTCPDGCNAEPGSGRTSGWRVIDSRSAFSASTETDTTNQDQQAVNANVMNHFPATVAIGRLAPQKHFRVGCAFENSATSAHYTNAGQAEAVNRQFVAFPMQETYDKSRTFCMRHLSGFADLASIHSPAQQTTAKDVCALLTREDMNSGLPHSCWIGMRRAERNVAEGAKERFSWSDGSMVDYVAWAQYEPNDVGDNGEDATEIDMRAGRSDTGYWNDNALEGEAGHGLDMAGCYGCYGTYGMYPLCETHRPAPPPPPLNGVPTATGFHQICQIKGSETPPPPAYAGSPPPPPPFPLDRYHMHERAFDSQFGQGCHGTFESCCIDPSDTNRFNGGNAAAGQCTVQGANQCSGNPLMVTCPSGVGVDDATWSFTDPYTNQRKTCADFGERAPYGAIGWSTMNAQCATSMGLSQGAQHSALTACQASCFNLYHAGNCCCDSPPSPAPAPAGYNPGQPQQQACTNGGQYANPCAAGDTFSLSCNPQVFQQNCCCQSGQQQACTNNGQVAMFCAATDTFTPQCQPTYFQAQCCCRTGQGR